MRIEIKNSISQSFDFFLNRRRRVFAFFWLLSKRSQTPGENVLCCLLTQVKTFSTWTRKSQLKINDNRTVLSVLCLDPTWSYHWLIETNILICWVQIAFHRNARFILVVSRPEGHVGRNRGQLEWHRICVSWFRPRQRGFCAISCEVRACFSASPISSVTGHVLSQPGTALFSNSHHVFLLFGKGRAYSVSHCNIGGFKKNSDCMETI